MQIERVEALKIGEPTWTGPDWWSTGPTDALFEAGNRERVGRLGLYNKPVGASSDKTFAVIVRVTTDTGLEGIGVVGLGSDALASIVESRLAPLIIGKNPFDVELLWELMFRSSINIGRKGLVVEAISGIDIALWDIMGKAVQRPVYDLLGGRTRNRIRAYASAGYAMHDFSEVVRMAKEYRAAGFTAMKMRFGWGPEDGRAGMRLNVDLVRQLREAIGDDMELMADAYMGWNSSYAIQMLERLKPYEIAWLEEPVLPEDYEGYARIN